MPIAARLQEGAQGNPPPARGCGGAGAGLSFLTACCHLVMEGPGHRGPRLRTLGRDPRPAGWSSGFCCALDAPQERVGGTRRRGATERVCAAGPRLPRGPDTPGCGKICLWRCPGYLCRDRAGPCPGSSTCWSLSKSPSVTAGEWRVKVQLTSARVPPALALLHKYWAVATWRGTPALCSVCSFPRAVWFLLIIQRRQTLLGRIEDGPAFPTPPGPGTLGCGMGHTQPDGSWMLAVSLGLPGRGPKGEQETQALFPVDTD